MLIIGLTGGIATGKSTVSKQLQTHYHLPVIDADLIARQVVEVDKPAYTNIVNVFGPLVPDLLLENGELNRPALGRKVFANEKLRAKLNGIVHPQVRRAIAWQVFVAWIKGEKLVFLDIPLLFESKLDKFCAISLAILCSEEHQLERLRARDEHLSLEEAQNRISAQMSLQEKRKRADVVICNDGSLEDLYLELDRFVKSSVCNPPKWLTFIQWIPPIGIIWGFFVYWRRGYGF